LIIQGRVHKPAIIFNKHGKYQYRRSDGDDIQPREMPKNKMVRRSLRLTAFSLYTTTKNNNQGSKGIKYRF
jgi:hypothetical protein